MDDYFQIYEFRFVDKDTSMGLVIFARTEEVAIRLVNLWNDSQDIYHWKKKRFQFKKKVYTKIPPYELEQAQEDYILQMKRKTQN